MTGNRRILFVLPRHSIHPIGALKIIYAYADRLAGREHKVALVHPREQGGFLKSAAIISRGSAMDDPVRYEPLWFTFHHPVESWISPCLHRDWIGRGFDICVATHWEVVPLVARHQSELGQPVYFLQDYESYMLGPRAVRLAIVKTCGVSWPVIVSSRAIEQIVRLYRPCGPLHCIPPPVDSSVFFRTLEVNDPSRIWIGFPARVEAAKRTADALAALEIVRHCLGPAMAIWSFGAAYPRSSLPSWIVHHQTVNDAQLRELYNRSAIFLVPSRYEGFGLPGAEAMACGAALVSTCNGGVETYARHGISALLCPPEHPEQLAEAICELLRDPELRWRIACQASADVRMWTWPNAVNAFEQVVLAI